MSDTVFIWDTMPLRDIDGKVLSVNGWSVIFTLTADREPENPEYIDANGNYDIALDWNNRHGRVMKEGVSPTTREWAGSPIL